MKESLKAKWMKVHAEYKRKQKEAAASRPTSSAAAAAATQEQTQASEGAKAAPARFELPYLPSDKYEPPRDDYENNMTKIFIKKLQQPVRETD